MNKLNQIRVEPVADVPLLLALTKQMGLAQLLNQHFPTHLHWQGLSLGEVCEAWLAFMLSQADHRLNQVEEWADSLLCTLMAHFGPEVRSLDWQDDRLARVLKALSADANWQAFEAALNQQLIRVYQLPTRIVRLDSTSASGYWEITEDGLFQLGHSKDHRPDLPQFKVMLATLDPLGMPLAVEVVSGEKADDPLYWPIIQKVQASLGCGGRLYVGDCKMSALQTRGSIHQTDDFYLSPLSAIQVDDAQLEKYLEPVWNGEVQLQQVKRPSKRPLSPLQTEDEAEFEVIAEGYSQTEIVSTVVEGQSVEWEERRLIVRSIRQAQAQTKALHQRLNKAKDAICKLTQTGRGRHSLAQAELEVIKQRVSEIEQRYRVVGLLKVEYFQSSYEQKIRAYGKRPAQVRHQRLTAIQVEIEPLALLQTERKLGWRVYATNVPVEELSLEQAVLAYREEYLVERCFGRLKGSSLALRPVYLSKDEHVTGLVRLLSLGVRILALLEHQVRSRLEEQKEELSGLYAGNPKRRTSRPTSELLLRAFCRVSLVVLSPLDRQLTPLTLVQERILSLLGWGSELYTRLNL
jgi:transposase